MNSRYSFEFFPPKSNASHLALDTCLHDLASWKPEFCSMTYGAGGSSQVESYTAIQRLQKLGHVPAAHITAVGASKAEVDQAAQAFIEAGIDHLVALRGDGPNGQFVSHPQGYQYGADLVAGLRRWFEGTISVAGYPETHPEATSAKADLTHLKTKVEAGANQIMTQYCYDTDSLLRFADQLQAQAVDVPIIVGIMPIHDIQAVQRFSARCGATVPDTIVAQFENLSDTSDQFNLAIDIALTQIEQLANHGLNQVHLYTLNRPLWVQGILQEMAQPKLAKSA
ncbi:MAG: methylenetetrahydrofolate reductase [Oceanospirillaceae bacterium]|nr:methylenetetrahydrofolate reductase [Oceanospirillaceae bacterium]